jgi:hypothetical protein
MEVNDFTELRISGAEVPPFSARGLTQTIEPIAPAIKLERAVNGRLIDMSIPSMKLYKSRISCNDLNPPAIGGLWPGMEVTIDCVAELCYPTGSPGLQERNAVSGSTRTEGDFTFYKPILVMVCTRFNTSTDEYGAAVSWSYEFEEQTLSTSP